MSPRLGRNVARVFVTMAAGGFLFAAAAQAQDAYPNKPVHIVVGFSAGSSTDVATRLIAEEMSQSLGQRVVVENRPGAASNVATEAVANAPADGYMLLMGTVANTINTALGRKVSFAFPGDFEPIALVGAVPMIVTVHPSVSAQTIGELIDLAKEEPDGIVYGSAGVGTAPHLSAELFASSIGASMVHVPYNGSGQAAQDLVAGRIDLLFGPASSVIAQIREGNLRGLATTLSKRSSVAPDLPTVAEAGIEGFDTSVWFGLMAPDGTPDAVVQKLADAVNSALQADSVKKAFTTAGIEPLGGSQQAFVTYIDREIANWRKVVEEAEISVN